MHSVHDVNSSYIEILELLINNVTMFLCYDTYDLRSEISLSCYILSLQFEFSDFFSLF